MLKSEPPPAPPKVPAGYRCQLLSPGGALLARCPTRKAGIKSAEAMYGEVEVKRDGKVWALYNAQGKLVAVLK